jgi:hypothetical protein
VNPATVLGRVLRFRPALAILEMILAPGGARSRKTWTESTGSEFSCLGVTSLFYRWNKAGRPLPCDGAIYSSTNGAPTGTRDRRS